MSTKSSIVALLISSVLLLAFLIALATYRGSDPPVRLLLGTVGAAGVMGILIYRWAHGE